MATTPLITVSIAGIAGRPVYVAHERGNWGPELNGDYKKHQLKQDGKVLSIDSSFLEWGEEFKLVVPVRSEGEAKSMYAACIAADVLVSERFDFDANYNTFWLLTPDFPVVRPMKWNQNNVFFYR